MNCSNTQSFQKHSKSIRMLPQSHDSVSKSNCERLKLCGKASNTLSAKSTILSGPIQITTGNRNPQTSLQSPIKVQAESSKVSIPEHTMDDNWTCLDRSGHATASQSATLVLFLFPLGSSYIAGITHTNKKFPYSK
jgi:hypothetical protein